MSAASERDFFAEVRRERDAEKRAATFDNNPNDIALALLAAEDVITGLEGRIVELEERVKHLACPVCGTVNPPEVHTCTPRPRVTTVQRWDVIDERLHSVYGKFKSRENAQFYADGTDFRVVQMAYVDVTAATTHDAPHTVKRVALIDEPTTQGGGVSIYGKCPRCHADGVFRERRPNGNDRCENGHSYPSAEAVMHTIPTPARPGAVTEAWTVEERARQFVRLVETCDIEITLPIEIAASFALLQAACAHPPAAASPEPVKWDSIGEPMTTRDWMQLARENAEKLADAQETIRDLRATAAPPEPGADYAIVSAAERWASADETGNRLALVVAMRELREAVSAKRTAAAPRAPETEPGVREVLNELAAAAQEYGNSGSTNSMRRLFAARERADDLLVLRAAAPRADATRDAALTGAFVDAKVQWSRETFGPGDRTAGICNHIRKELTEAEREPTDASEWADIILLAMDGAGRSGITGDALVRAVIDKDARNRQRSWPDWRTLPADAPIEHHKTDAPRADATAVGVTEDAKDAARYRFLRSIALGQDVDAWTRWYFLYDEHFLEASTLFDSRVDALRAALPETSGG